MLDGNPLEKGQLESLLGSLVDNDLLRLSLKNLRVDDAIFKTLLASLGTL